MPCAYLYVLHMLKECNERTLGLLQEHHCQNKLQTGVQREEPRSVLQRRPGGQPAPQSKQVLFHYIQTQFISYPKPPRHH